MCGICGIAIIGGHPIDRVELATMNQTMMHRGPDGDGYHLSPGIGLGHRRLKIIDLDGGKQPLYNENDKICIVFNGEIYNFIDLRKQLIARGHLFKTSTDSETLVHLYEEYGLEMLDHISGMFAFALWDQTKRLLFLARDRFGKKPLFYSVFPQGIVFGSEMKALLSSNHVDPEIDFDGLGDFVSLGYTLAPRTVIKSITQLCPGEYLTWHEGSINQGFYWQLTPQDAGPPTELENIELTLMEKLRSAVSSRLVSDVPLGAFLSGGIDSSAIVALMTEIKKEPIKTFSIGFSEESFNELPYTRLIAKKFGTEHFERTIDSDVANLLPQLIWALDEPFSDTSAIPMYHLAQFAREQVTVALSGDGADEVFAGYPTLQADRLAYYYQMMPEMLHTVIKSVVNRLPVSLNKVSFDFKAKQFIAGVSSPASQWHYHWRLITSEMEQQALMIPDVWSRRDRISTMDIFEEHFAQSPFEDTLSRCLYVDMKTWLPNNILTKVDRMTMAHSLEARAPFLDHKIVDFGFQLPVDLKLHRFSSKYILKKALGPILPEKIIKRKKRGFNSPMAIWLKTSLHEILQDTLSSKTINQHGLFKSDFIQSLITEHLSGQRDNSYRLWSLLCFQLWYDQFIAPSKNPKTTAQFIPDATPSC